MTEYDIDALRVLPEEVRTGDARGEEHAAAPITPAGSRAAADRLHRGAGPAPRPVPPLPEARP
ncbi:hypothetical protein ACH4ZU_12940 [Streptomyces sp. NPDC020472]|uniref:hypothetical protein n=1 Tax=Streptomyces sp. NPDC020472 TaxID=3365075 RepID=UPI0037B2FA78